jgi:hypothetical protein
MCVMIVIGEVVKVIVINSKINQNNSFFHIIYKYLYSFVQCFFFSSFALNNRFGWANQAEEFQKGRSARVSPVRLRLFLYLNRINC